MRTVLTFVALVLLPAACGPGRLDRPMTAAALEAAVLGQDADALRARLGPPDWVEPVFNGDGSASGAFWWFYGGIIRDGPGAPPRDARLCVTDGRVSDVRAR